MSRKIMADELDLEQLVEGGITHDQISLGAFEWKHLGQLNQGATKFFQLNVVLCCESECRVWNQYNKLVLKNSNFLNRTEVLPNIS